VVALDLSVGAIRAPTCAAYEQIVDLSDNRMVGCEALARWRLPDAEQLPVSLDVLDKRRVNPEGCDSGQRSGQGQERSSDGTVRQVCC